MGTFLAVLFALCSAALNALSAVFQRRATGQVEARDLFHGRIIKAVIRSRLWLAGIGLNVAGFFAQALALHSGTLALVQPLLTTDVVFLLIFLHFASSLTVKRRAFAGAVLIMLGLSALLAVARPEVGTRTPAFLPWAIAFGIITVIITSGAIVMRSGVPIPLRAAIAGSMAGLHFAFTAAFTKLVIGQLQFGFVHTLLSWQLAGLIIVGITSGLSMQSMYGAGPLAITQPALEIVEAVAGVQLGILLFSDRVHSSPGALAAEAAAGLVAAFGIVLLAGASSLQKTSKELH